MKFTLCLLFQWRMRKRDEILAGIANASGASIITTTLLMQLFAVSLYAINKYIHRLL